LWHDGAVTVPPFGGAENPPAVCPACEETLRRMDAGARQCLGENAPAFDMAAASWAAVQFFQACQFLLCRDVSADVVRQMLARPCPSPHGASADYSVDIIFRFLPDLFELSQRLAPRDALVDALKAWACEWPLSSVGIPRATPGQPAPRAPGGFADSPALGRLYADRVAACSDMERMDDPRIRDILRADIGMHGDLHPEISRKLANSAPATLTHEQQSRIA
jgi:hypothetical protein